jgi:hypothetical protein
MRREPSNQRDGVAEVPVADLDGSHRERDAQVRVGGGCGSHVRFLPLRGSLPISECGAYVVQRSLGLLDTPFELPKHVRILGLNQTDLSSQFRTRRREPAAYVGTILGPHVMRGGERSARL